ncbi:MAG: hypothetical protein FWF63_07770 [Fibromonadales bacterium]|nr:hypothetical protein [Fibromonadales bacterium]
MKTNRFLQLAASFVLSLAFIFSLVACDSGGLSGTYESAEYKGMTRTFSGDKYILEGPAGKTEGTFTTSGDELTITQGNDVTVFKFKLEGNTLKLANAKAKLEDPKQWQTWTKK